MYALHALLGIEDGRTNEVTAECADLDQAVTRLRDLVGTRPDFRAVTLLHVEDLPLTLGEAEPEGPPSAITTFPVGEGTEPRGALRFEVVVRADGTTTVTGTSEGLEGVHIHGDDPHVALVFLDETVKQLRGAPE